VAAADILTETMRRYHAGDIDIDEVQQSIGQWRGGGVRFTPAQRTALEELLDRTHPVLVGDPATL
jgi:hypothetical protein